MNTKAKKTQTKVEELCQAVVDAKDPASYRKATGQLKLFLAAKSKAKGSRPSARPNGSEDGRV